MKLLLVGARALAYFDLLIGQMSKIGTWTWRALAGGSNVRRKFNVESYTPSILYNLNGRSIFVCIK